MHKIFEFHFGFFYIQKYYVKIYIYILDDDDIFA
jgi:hypothetical protein